LVGDSAHLLPRQRRQLAEIASVEELHRVVGLPAVDAVVVDADDARVSELHEGVELPFEELHDAPRRLELRSTCQHLESDVIAGSSVASAIHGRHTPAPEQLEDFIALRNSTQSRVRITVAFGFVHRELGVARARPRSDYELIIQLPWCAA